MAVSTEVFRSEHVWTGVETSFNTGWPAALAAYVKGIFRNPAGFETALVQGVNYTVSIAAGTKLVTCTPVAIPPAPGVVVFYRETPATVSIVLQDNFNTPASVHQDLHDRAAMRDGEIKGALARSLVLPPGASETGAYEMAGRQFQNVGTPTLPSHVARLSDLQGVVAGQGNVPSPLAGQINYLLMALGAGSFAWQDAATVRNALGGTVVGQAVFTATDPVAARTFLGGTTVGQAVFTATDVAAILALLGLTDRVVPVGAIQSFSFQSAPSGWIKANGALLSRAAYPALFAAANADGLVTEAVWSAGNDGRYSAGDGATTFRIPDYRGKFFRPWDDGRGIDAGRAFGSSQNDAFQSHYHQHYKSTGGAVAGGPYPVLTGIGFVNELDPAQLVRSPITDGTNGVPRTAAETRPINTSVLVCIKT